MIKGVFELMLGGYESAMYYCTLCNRPYKALHEATEHAKFCGQAVPIQPAFRSYTTAATFEEDDDVQDYAVPWQGLTEQERNDIENYFSVNIGILVFDAIEAVLKKKNT